MTVQDRLCDLLIDYAREEVGQKEKPMVTHKGGDPMDRPEIEDRLRLPLERVRLAPADELAEANNRVVDMVMTLVRHAERKTDK